MIARVLAGLLVVPLLLGAAAAPADREHIAFRFADSAIDESSALVVLPGGLFATTNDSGDTGRVFTVDGSGRTVGVTTWSPDPTDVEALAPAPDGDVWVGDIGDNRSVRDSVQVAKVPVGRGDRSVSPAVYDLVYPDGAHDAETLLCDPATGRLYVASKSWLGGTLYAAPAHLSTEHPNRLRALAPVLPVATDGAFWPDGKHVIVRGYGAAEIYTWPAMREVADLDLPRQPQGEGIGIAADGTVYAGSEGLHAEVITVPLPADARAALQGASSSASPSPSVPSSPSQSPSPSQSSSPSPANQQHSEAEEETERSWWPWALGGLVGLVAIGVLLRSLRPR